MGKSTAMDESERKAGGLREILSSGALFPAWAVLQGVPRMACRNGGPRMPLFWQGVGC
jgi:hypothetical protein